LAKVLHGVRYQFHKQIQLRLPSRRSGLLAQLNKFLMGVVSFGVIQGQGL
jgi:hypothetical protein